MIESGMVRLNARVPIRDDVRKQPLWTETSITRCWINTYVHETEDCLHLIHLNPSEWVSTAQIKAWKTSPCTILMPELWPGNTLRVRCSPEPEELREDGSDEAVNEDVRPHQLAGKLEGLEAGVMEQQEARPQQQQVEQTHKPWETHKLQLRAHLLSAPVGRTLQYC